MSDNALKTPFDALDRTFVLPDQPLSLLAEKHQDGIVRGHAFTIGTFSLVLDTVRHPCEIYEELPLCRLPGSPPSLLGMANQRGNIIPIFDLHTLLGYTPERGTSYFLVIGSREEAVGFRITSLLRPVELAAENRITTSLPIPHLLEPHIRQFFQQDEQIYAQWDVHSFLKSLAADQ